MFATIVQQTSIARSWRAGNDVEEEGKETAALDDAVMVIFIVYFGRLKKHLKTL